MQKSFVISTTIVLLACSSITMLGMETANNVKNKMDAYDATENNLQKADQNIKAAIQKKNWQNAAQMILANEDQLLSKKLDRVEQSFKQLSKPEAKLLAKYKVDFKNWLKAKRSSEKELLGKIEQYKVSIPDYDELVRGYEDVSEAWKKSHRLN